MRLGPIIYAGEMFLAELTQNRVAYLRRTTERLSGCLLFAVMAANHPVMVQTNAPDHRPNTSSTAATPCVEPAPLFSAADYEGPLNKAVTYFSRKLEIKTVHEPRSGKGHKLCSLSSADKFRLSFNNTVEPVTFVGAAFNAGLDQAQNNDPSFGQGMAGYGKHYAAALADSASEDFFHTFAFPVIFRQDPRYYRKFEGPISHRLGHALSHIFVARSDSGKPMLNFSEWLGTTASTALANTYHPGNRRGIGPAASRIAVSIGTDAGFDVLREFWPELVHTFRLPFRVRGNHP